MKIGNVEIKGRAALAPMAGVADMAFRTICVDYGAAYVIGEMVSCKGLCFGDKKSVELLFINDWERPAAIQLFGDDPDTMASAAEKAMDYHPDVIDINMGCPAPKIVGNKSGSALMRDPDLCFRIVRAVSRIVPVPVTAKIRKGYSPAEINAVEVALACEYGGASAITVHGRTRDQMYAPPVDWNIIRDVKQALSIPVIGNGNVDSAASAAAMYEHTGCDLIMVGRAALGSPWIFSQIEAYLNHGTIIPNPPVSMRMETMLRQAKAVVQYKGEYIAMLQMRKHAAWYMRGMQGAAGLRTAAGQITTLSELEQLARMCVERLSE